VHYQAANRQEVDTGQHYSRDLANEYTNCARGGGGCWWLGSF